MRFCQLRQPTRPTVESGILALLLRGTPPKAVWSHVHWLRLWAQPCVCPSELQLACQGFSWLSHPLPLSSLIARSFHRMRVFEIFRSAHHPWSLRNTCTSMNIRTPTAAIPYSYSIQMHMLGKPMARLRHAGGGRDLN